MNFCLGCLALIMVRGAANCIARGFTSNPRVSGIDGLLAACLGYNFAVGLSPLSILSTFLSGAYNWLRVELSSPSREPLRIGMLCLFLLLGCYPGLVIAILTGGTLGYAFGIMHPQWLMQ